MERQFYKIKSEYINRMKHPDEQNHSKDYQVNIKDEYSDEVYSIPEYFYAEKIGDVYEEFLTRTPIVDVDSYDDGVGVFCEGIIQKKGYLTFMEPNEMFEEVKQEELDKYFFELDQYILRIDAINFAHFAKQAYDVKLHEQLEQNKEKTLIIRR